MILTPNLIRRLCSFLSQLSQKADVGLELFQFLCTNHTSCCSITTPHRWVCHLQRERERERESHIYREAATYKEEKTSGEKSETHMTLIKPGRSSHNTKDTTTCLLLKEGDNQAWWEHRFFFFFCIWKVIIKHFSSHDEGLTSEGRRSQLSSRARSRLWRWSHFFRAESSSTSASAGANLQGEKKLKINTSFLFLLPFPFVLSVSLSFFAPWWRTEGVCSYPCLSLVEIHFFFLKSNWNNNMK